MIVISGKTASGKDTIIKHLENKGIQNVITYTTRPPRDGEIQGREYHFINEDDFMKKVAEGFFAEYRKYNTLEGTWYYGSAIADYQDNENKIIVLPPEGYRNVKERLGKDFKDIYIYANDKTIKKRLTERGDSEEEVMRRMYHDSIDFENFECEADAVICNNYGDDIETVVDKVMYYIEHWRDH